ncbi:MAG: hypothetical protein JWM27_2129 [Gemmatimonadetes bacterium]|nr:hypothetical protein [Gemmatimonadota bacterium]
MPQLTHVQEQLVDAVVHRAGVDRRFRTMLLESPRAAIREAFGVDLPADFNLRFIEKDAGVDALIVLPDVKADDGELSDDDLEAVAGGDSGDWAPPPPPPGGP